MRAPRQNRAASIATFASLDHRHTPVDLCACDVVGWIDASSSGVIFCFRTSRAPAFWDGRPVPIGQAAGERQIPLAGRRGRHGGAVGNTVGSAEGMRRGSCLRRKLFSSFAVKCIKRQFGTGNWQTDQLIGCPTTSMLECHRRVPSQCRRSLNSTSRSRSECCIAGSRLTVHDVDARLALHRSIEWGEGPDHSRIPTLINLQPEAHHFFRRTGRTVSKGTIQNHRR